MDTAPRWTDVAAAADLFEGASIEVRPQGMEIALHCVDGVPYATDNVCTHGAGSLCEGWLEGFEIECPLHQGRFDIRDGRPLCDPVTEPIRVYRSKVEEGRVLIDLGDAAT
jgi:naphthalene 1,2-dioxygenase system ferredoxin subunit